MLSFILAVAFFACGIITGMAFSRAARTFEGMHDVFDDGYVEFTAEPTPFVGNHYWEE